MSDRTHERERAKREHLAARAAETRRKRAAVGLPPGGGARLNVHIDGEWHDTTHHPTSTPKPPTTADHIDEIMRHAGVHLLPWQRDAYQNLLAFDLTRSTRRKH